MHDITPSGEPNNYNGAEHCVEVYASSGFWNDDSCDEKNGYICKKTGDKIHMIILNVIILYYTIWTHDPRVISLNPLRAVCWVLTCSSPPRCINGY